MEFQSTVVLYFNDIYFLLFSKSPEIFPHFLPSAVFLSYKINTGDNQSNRFDRFSQLSQFFHQPSGRECRQIPICSGTLDILLHEV